MILASSSMFHRIKFRQLTLHDLCYLWIAPKLHAQILTMVSLARIIFLFSIECFSFSKNIELFFSISEIMTGNQESICVFYLQQLCDSSLGENAFKTPWGSLILKNCNSDGALYTFKSIKEYKEVRKQYWLYMTLKVFRYRDHAFPIFCCSECENMKTVENFGLYADPCKISKMQCIHSKAAGFLVRNWDQIW